MKMKHPLCIVKVFNPPAISKPQHVGAAWVRSALGVNFPVPQGSRLEQGKGN